MKISKYMNIDRIEFIVTYYCTGKCLHCSVGDKLGKSDGFSHVRTDAAINAVERLSQYFHISSVMTFGGEPLLYPDTVCAIHKTACSCGVEKRQLITNGYFSKDEKRIAQVAHSLLENGANDILLSVDAFHQRTIPIAPVFCFAHSLKQARGNIRLQPAWVVNKGHTNPYNAETVEVISEFRSLGIPVADGNDIFLAGNAAKHLAQYYPAPVLDMSLVCGSAPYTEPLTNITSLSIVPNGDVMICSFVIGNIYRESIEDIISRYDPYDNDLMRSILTGGIHGLIEAAEKRGIPADTSGCRSICDLCHKINNHA